MERNRPLSLVGSVLGVGVAEGPELDRRQLGGTELVAAEVVDVVVAQG